MVNHECAICFKTVSLRSSLRRHIRRTHPESEEAKEQRRKTNSVKEKSVICPLCRATLKHHQELVEHLTEAHSVLIKEEAHDFLSTSDFLKWKQEVEKVTESLFVKTRGTSAVKCVQGTKDVYVCHRSGRIRAENGERFRQPKSQGSQKFDAHCPARMKVVTTEGRVFLNFLPTHVGHNTDPAHLRLTRSEKEMLARKMAEKRSLDDILQEIRDSSEPQFGRLKILSRKDLVNIGRDANLLASVYSGSNVDEWVSQQRQSGNILFYKPKGAGLEAFSPEDFILCLVNSQRDLTSEFISLDLFETPSSGELHVFSISAADDIALPVAIMITNRKDIQVMNFFLKEVASSSHLDLNPCCVFHSRNTNFYDAWSTWFGRSKTQTIGSWHIEQEWRSNLDKTISNRVKKREANRAFKLLMETTTEKDFTELCENIICDIARNESEDFKSYFAEMAASFKDWVRFYRTPKLTEMNAIFEKLYRLLKATHLKYEKFETTELLANSLIEIMNCCREGETKKALREIIARHKIALKTECTITLESENVWQVQFKGPREATYAVGKADFSCQCLSKCEDCKFCLHAFKCACLDWSKGNMCKHVHAICISLFSDREITVEEEGFEESEPEPENFEVIISEAVTSEEVEDGKLELQQDFSQILSMIRTVEDVNLVRNAFRLITPSLGLNKSTLPLAVEVPHCTVKGPPSLADINWKMGLRSFRSSDWDSRIRTLTLPKKKPPHHSGTVLCGEGRTTEQ